MQTSSKLIISDLRHGDIYIYIYTGDSAATQRVKYEWEDLTGSLSSSDQIIRAVASIFHRLSSNDQLPPVLLDCSDQ